MNAETDERISSHSNPELNLPRIGITMGDAAGIGAEIILKALADEKINRVCRPIIIGDESFLRKTASDLNLEFDFVSATNNPPQNSNQTLVYNLNNLPGEIIAGEESAATGKACAEYSSASRLIEKREMGRG